MKKPFLLIIDGMTGAGKSTVATLLSKRIPRVAVIGMDKVKRYISDFERGERDNSIAREIIFEMTKKYFDHNLSVIIDQSFKLDRELKLYEKLAQKYSFPIYKVQLFAAPKLAFKRVTSRQQDWSDKMPEGRIKRNISLFKSREKEGFMIIDTSKMGVARVANIILKKVIRISHHSS